MRLTPLGGMHYNEALGHLIAAVGAALSAAPSQERQLLAEAIEQYVARFPDAFLYARNADAARILRELFAEITETVEAFRGD
jgi:hypothetical protein